MECEWVMKIKMNYGMWMSYENKISYVCEWA